MARVARGARGARRARGLGGVGGSVGERTEEGREATAFGGRELSVKKPYFRATGGHSTRTSTNSVNTRTTNSQSAA